MWLCFYRIIIFFFFDHPWGVLPWKQTSPATGPTSELVLRWPLCQTQCVLYRLALKFCMSLVHSDSASSSRSSGLCRCLLWDNACGNLYFGLLISVAADPYHFDLRKLIKGPALSACSVQSSPALRDLPSPQFTIAREWWMLSSQLFGTREGYPSLATWKPLDSEDCTFPGNCGLRTRPVSEQGSVSSWGHPELLHFQPWMLTTTEIFLGTSPCKFKILRDTFLSLLP